MHFTNLNYYELLGVSKDASEEEIKKSYKRLVQFNHPDNNIHKTSEEIKKCEENIKNLNEAYRILSNPNRRYQYDQFRESYILWTQEKQKQKTAEKSEDLTPEKSQEEEVVKEEPPKKDLDIYFPGHRQKTVSQQPKETTSNLWDHIKEDYNDIKLSEEEYPLKQRHHDIDEQYKKYGMQFVAEDSKLDEFVFQVYRGLVHISKEALYQMKKLSYINKGDSLPKYVLRNRKLIGLITAGVILGVAGKNDIDTAKQEMLQSVIEDENYESIINLNRNYTVQNGDILSKIAEESGTSIYRLQNLNNLSEDSFLQIGQQLKIPYEVGSSDLSFYTSSIKINPTTSLENIAKAYETDIDTLLKLNKTSIVETNGTYTFLTDTINVPNFITKEQLKTLKDSKEVSYQ